MFERTIEQSSGVELYKLCVNPFKFNSVFELTSEVGKEIGRKNQV